MTGFSFVSGLAKLKKAVLQDKNSFVSIVTATRHGIFC